jgi:hypothetical protein
METKHKISKVAQGKYPRQLLKTFAEKGFFQQRSLLALAIYNFLGHFWVC